MSTHASPTRDGPQQDHPLSVEDRLTIVEANLRLHRFAINNSLRQIREVDTNATLMFAGAIFYTILLVAVATRKVK